MTLTLLDPTTKPMVVLKVSCDVEFFKNNGPQAKQVVPSDVGDVYSCEVIKTMGIGISCPQRPMKLLIKKMMEKTQAQLK
jgi:hypothetical protein